jgi:hypothetical protein
LGTFKTITEVAQKFWQLFSTGKSCAFIQTEKRFGLHFGRFFHKLIRSPWLRRRKVRGASFVCSAQQEHSFAPPHNRQQRAKDFFKPAPDILPGFDLATLNSYP